MRTVLGWLLAVGACCLVLAGAARGEEIDAETARTIAALHPFGVRGLPGCYDDCAEPEKRAHAIDLALEWLAAKQADDGSWKPQDLTWCNGARRKEGAPDGPGLKYHATGVTGLAAVAFLGAGYTHRGKHPYAATLRKALTWLVSQQDGVGCVGARVSQTYLYGHAFGTLALVEAYALTGDPKLHGPAQKALDFSALARNPGFAWRYGIKPGQNDTSLTGCMGMPLYVALRMDKAADRAGVLQPLGLDDTVFEGMRAWIDKMTDPDYGRVGYVQRGTGPARPQEFVEAFPSEKSESLTAIAVLMRQVLPGVAASSDGEKKNQEMIRKGLLLMRRLMPWWDPKGGTIDLYYWYYGTMAMRQEGGDDWKAWDKALATALLYSQHEEGTVCGVRGSWDPIGVWGRTEGGRIYATALCAVMLETPDRMRPLPEDRSDLLRALETGIQDPDRIAGILRGLGELQVPGAGETVASWMGNDNAEICAAAAEAMGHLDAGAEGVRTMVGLLHDKRVPVRRAVVRALAAQGTRLQPILDELVPLLADADLQVAVGAARALAAAGDASVAAELRSHLNEGDIALRVASSAAVDRLTSDHAATQPVFVLGMGAKDVSVRVEAAEALERMAPDIGPAEKVLVDGLVDPNARVRVHSASALHAAGKMREACVGAWVSALDAADSRDRLLALQRLEHVPAPQAVPKLMTLLRSGPTPLRVAAAGALQAVGPGAQRAAAILAWCSANGPQVIRSASVQALAALKMDADAAKKYLIPEFGTGARDRKRVYGAANALAKMGETVVPVIAETLRTGDQAARTWMLYVLRRMGPVAAPAVPDIARELEGTKDADQQLRALRALVAIGPGAEQALPAIEKALDAKSKAVGATAVRAVAAVGVGSERAVRLLSRLVTNPDETLIHLRIAALESVPALGKDAVPLATDLLTPFESRKLEVRTAAIGAFADLWEYLADFLLHELPKAKPRVQEGIARVAGRKGPEAKKFVRPLAKIMVSGDSGAGSVCATALGAIGKPAVRSLLRYLKHREARVRSQAARGLGLVGADAKRALKTLKRLLQDPDLDVRYQAGLAIKKIEDALK